MDPSAPFTTPPVTPQPPEQQPIAPQPPASQPPTALDPGKTLGIVGFIMAFIGLQLVGLILSIVGFNKSKNAGFKNSLAFVGIILNGVFLALAIIIIPIIVLSIFVSYNGISERANTSAAQSSAAQVAKNAELYAADNGTYPTTFSQISNKVGSGITFSKKAITSEPPYVSTVEFSTCGTSGNKIGYWDYQQKTTLYTYAGTASKSSTCTIAVN